MTVGRLVADKGQADLIRSVAEVSSVFPAVRVALVGDGPLRGDLERAAREAKLGDRAIFTGTRSDVAELLQAADVFALPSLREGCGLALLEAMAVGLPAVASAVGGVPELLREGRGLLVEPGRPDLLRDALSLVLGDPSLRRELGGRARAAVEQFYSASKMTERLQVLYERQET